MLCKTLLSNLLIISNLTVAGSPDIRKLVNLGSVSTSIYDRDVFVEEGPSFSDLPAEIGATISYQDETTTVYKDIYIKINDEKLRLKAWNSANHSYLDLFCELLNPDRPNIVNMKTSWLTGLARSLVGYQSPEISLIQKSKKLEASIFEDPRGSIWRVKTMSCSNLERPTIIF